MAPRLTRTGCRVFVDESARSSYLLCAAVVMTGDLHQVRQALRALLPAGASRLHAATDSDRLRKHVLSLLAHQPVRATIYRSFVKNQQEARAIELARVALDSVELGADRLVIEARAGQDHADRRTLALTLNPLAGSARHVLPFEHRAPESEPLLWIPDIVAWAYGRGAQWRTRVESILEGSVDCS